MKVLIADSGGTKTDWCLIDEDGHQVLFTTESYHPVNWNFSFFERIGKYWEKYPVIKIQMYFFGAGCLEEEKAHFLKVKLKEIGFNKVAVRSDLHGAGYASLGVDNGTVAILGTGSIMFEWRNQQVKNIIGGKGHLLGDEGSGYYFGALLLKAFRENELSDAQREIVIKEIATIDTLELTNKFEIAEIASLLSAYQSLFSFFHKENTRLFTHLHLQRELEKISIIGSYGANHQLFFEQELHKKGVKKIHFTERPINGLVEQKAFFIE